MANPVLYYFPGNKKYPFGHVALGVEADRELAPVGYLSFGAGTGRASDPLLYKVTSSAGDVYEQKYHMDLRSETQIYQGVIAIDLPACPPDVLRAAIREFSELDRSDYGLFTKNCANAVLNFMKTIGCIPREEAFYPPVRPQTIAKRAAEIALRGIQEKRNAIKAADEPPLRKIMKLIRNDVERLREQIKYDEISHLVFKSKSTKENKIKQLEALANLGDTAGFVNTTEEYENFHRALLAAKELGSKTAKNLDDCLHYFPKELLSSKYVRKTEIARAADVDFYKSERKFILEDDELNEMEMIRKLIENDVGRLRAQVKADETSFSGQFKSSKKKIDKVIKLESVKRYLDEPVDYPACLNYLCMLMTDKAMAGKTTNNLQQCIDRFPYDRLPLIEEMRSVLTNLDPLLAEAERSSPTFFAVKKAPDEISDMRAVVPKGSEVIDALSCKEVYERYIKVNALLQAALEPGEKKRNSELQLFYARLNKLTALIVSPLSAPDEKRASSSATVNAATPGQKSR